MDIYKADYDTIVGFGTLNDIKTKLSINKETIKDIINKDYKGSGSLLETSLSYRKFEISNYLLDNGANVNVISEDGYNEFHILASNICYDGAIEIGKRLLEKGTSLMAIDKKYGNTAFFSLCNNGIARSEEIEDFLIECLDYVSDIDIKNKRGLSVRDIIEKRGTPRIKEIIKRKY